MSRNGLNRVSLALPLTFSVLALALVLANILAGVPPQPDETTSAHIWQMLIVLQFPFLAAFLLTADWRTSRPARLFALQLAAIVAACVPVWLAGY